MFSTAFALRNLLSLLLIGGFAAGLLAQPIHTCTVIPVAQPAAVAGAPSYLPPGARAAVSYKPSNKVYDQKWAVGSTVTVRFLGGSSALRGRVMKYANEWTRYANLNFRVVNSGPADIRIGFTQNGGSWSVVGNSSTRVPQSRPSMNFGWLNDRTPDYEVKRTVLHEFGHALGLLHEHQNPTGGIPWNEEVVYEHYYRTQGWDRRTTYNNVMATASHDATQFSAYDQASIMHYPVSPKLTSGQYSVGMNKELSATDRAYIARMYPGRRASNTATAPPARPTTTSTSPARRPTTSTTTNTSGHRPLRPATRPAESSNRKTYRVRISNELGRNQQAETVRLFIANKEYRLTLDRNGRTRKELNLNLPAGKYDYRITTSSTYGGYRNIRSGGRVRRQYVEHKIAGDGQGVLAVAGGAELALFGSYDEARGRMKVYLGSRGR